MANAEQLAAAKHSLGVDEPRPTSATTEDGPRLTTTSISTLAHNRIRAVALLAGTVKLRQGHQGKLRLATSKAGRALISDLKKAGVTHLTAIATVIATIVPGVQSIKRFKVVLKLG